MSKYPSMPHKGKNPISGEGILRELAGTFRPESTEDCEFIEYLLDHLIIGVNDHYNTVHAPEIMADMEINMKKYVKLIGK